MKRNYLLLIFSFFLIIYPTITINKNDSLSVIAQTNYINQLLKLTNQERQAAGLPPLNLSSALTQAAQNHAEDMAKNGLMSHQGSNGSNPTERANQAGYRSSYIGENISAGRDIPQSVVKAWIDDPQHRQNLLNPNYTDVGFGYVKDKNSQYQDYWVQLFGKSESNSQSSTESSSFPPSNGETCQGNEGLSAITCTGDELNQEENALVQQINAYRRQYRLNSLSVSSDLTVVANRHLLDLQENANRYNRQGKDWQFGWSNCPFDGNQPQSFNCMWQAPQRLNTGYQGNAYEIICRKMGSMSADQAFNCWQNQPDNRDFILNQGQWRNFNWKSIGVALNQDYAILWLGETLDNESSSPPLPSTSRPYPRRIW